MLATSHFSESQNGFIELPLHALSAHPQAENGAKTFKKDEPAAFLQDIFALLLQEVLEAQLKRYSTLLLNQSIRKGSKEFDQYQKREKPFVRKC